MVVCARAPEDDGIHLVFLGKGGHGLADFQLRLSFRQVQGPGEQYLRGYVSVELPGTGQAQGSQHFLPFRIGGGNVAAHAYPSLAVRSYVSASSSSTVPVTPFTRMNQAS